MTFARSSALEICLSALPFQPPPNHTIERSFNWSGSTPMARMRSIVKLRNAGNPKIRTGRPSSAKRCNARMLPNASNSCPVPVCARP